MLRAFLVAAALCAAACHPKGASTSPDLDARLTRLEQRLDRLSGVNGADDTPATPDVRLLRVEARLDKIITFLKDAVPAKLDEDQVYAIPVDPLDPALGPPGAAVTMVLAYEYLCPYCALIEPTLDDLRKKYPADLRIVGKYFVIHGEPAIPSGKAACAAQRQGKYAAFNEAVWNAVWPKPGEAPEREQASTASLELLAKASGLDVKRFKADVDGVCTTWLTTSASTLTKFGAGGTPSFWINGRPVQARSLEDFAATIDAELARVKASGVAPAKYYQDVVLAKGAGEAIMVSPFD
jgi:protein-disulfide isomerase